MILNSSPSKDSVQALRTRRLHPALVSGVITSKKKKKLGLDGGVCSSSWFPYT
jgi:hypothetical protein